jgi:hypothetical protein
MKGGTALTRRQAVRQSGTTPHLHDEGLGHAKMLQEEPQ